VLVEGAGAERATGWLLVHEHGSLAVRAGALAHRRRLGGLVRHRGCRARGERSHPVSAAPVPTLNRGGGPVSSSPREAILGARRTRPAIPRPGEASTADPATERGPPEGRASWSGRIVGLGVRRRPSCSCACREARSCARARAASRTATCCNARASSHTLARRRRGRPRTAGPDAPASEPMLPGTSPLPRRSLPFGRDRRTARASVPLCTFFERRAASVHSTR